MSQLARDDRKGLVLVMVLIVVAMLSLASYTFSDYMFIERKSVRMSGRQMQSRALADSGVESIKQLLMKTPAELDEAGGLYDNPGRFRGMLVVDDVAEAPGTPRHDPVKLAAAYSGIISGG